MATYTYETIPQKPSEQPVRFEIRQSMLDDPLEAHPETGAPVRRVITGGFGFMSRSKPGGNRSGGAHQHGAGCCGGFR